jgi:regulator of sigma E protease
MYLEFLTLTVGTFGVLLVHELGHLLTARFLGLKVSSLSIGLGPEIIGYTDRCGTRWKIALLPIGGSCAFFDDVGAQMSSHSADHRTCSNAARRQRGMVYLAGPISNLVCAGIVFLVMICRNGKFTIESIELNTELARS